MKQLSTATEMMRMADENARVHGHYYGVPFIGTALWSRQLNWGPDYPEMLSIKLDEQIMVFGNSRDHILLCSREQESAEDPDYMTLERI